VNGFEGSFLGDAGRIGPDTVMECGVCWWVYDPARGDDNWQIPPGTPFAELPGHWRCPGCDAPREQFMVLCRTGDEQVHRDRSAPVDQPALHERRDALQRAYQTAAGRMRGLPVYNDKLDIRIVGLQPWGEGMVCVAATPWCMNILLLPGEGSPPRMEGTKREVAFPSGTYTFVAGVLEGVGTVESCSLFSPMEQFDQPRSPGTRSASCSGSPRPGV